MSRENNTKIRKMQKFAPRRGWPVVATGTAERPNFPAYARWRKLLSLPEESEDFSDRDAFDVAGHVIANAPREELPPLVVKALQLGTDSVNEREVADFIDLQEYSRELAG
jgi:hypothetical protein